MTQMVRDYIRAANTGMGLTGVEPEQSVIRTEVTQVMSTAQRAHVRAQSLTKFESALMSGVVTMTLSTQAGLFHSDPKLRNFGFRREQGQGCRARDREPPGREQGRRRA